MFTSLSQCKAKDLEKLEISGFASLSTMPSHLLLAEIFQWIQRHLLTSLKILCLRFARIDCDDSNFCDFVMALKNSQLSSLDLQFGDPPGSNRNYILMHKIKLIRAIMSNFDLQEFRYNLLKDWIQEHEALRAVVEGILSMNKAGRRYLQKNPANKQRA